MKSQTINYSWQLLLISIFTLLASDMVSATNTGSNEQKNINHQITKSKIRISQETTRHRIRMNEQNYSESNNKDKTTSISERPVVDMDQEN